MTRGLLGKYQSIAVIILLVGTVALPMGGAASSENAVVSPEPAASTAAGNATQYWALLVGVGTYAENPEQDRPDMITDVNDFRDTLLQSPWWSADHIRTLTEENATIRNVLAGFRWLRTVASRNDIVVVYLSTHGFPLGYDLPPRDEVNGSDTALISYWGFSYISFVFWDDEINVLLNRINCNGVCLLVDSCYAGGFQDHWRIPKSAAPQKRVTIMGSCEDEVSYSGAFAPYVIDGLRGYADTNKDGIVTAQEVFAYAKPRTMQEQHPTMYDNYPGGLPLTTNILQKTSSSLTVPPQQTGSGVPPIMVPALDETSAICGYVTSSGQPIAGALVSASGRINHSESYQNQTTTDQAGFYFMHVPSMRLRVTASAEGFCDASKGPFNIPQNKTVWVNLTLVPRPPETATVCGYVTSEQDGTPLVANVTMDWFGNHTSSYHNATSSDTNGFYRMSIAPGRIDLTFTKDGYFSEDRYELYITGAQTLWENVSLYPLPPETSTVCGYITDATTHATLQGVHIGFYWVNLSTNRSYDREVQTNASGFFTTPIAPGELYIDVQANGYDFYDPYRHDAQPAGLTWMNLSLERQRLNIEMMQPLNALYIHDNRIFPATSPRVFGPLTISAMVGSGFFGEGHASKVEFYIDGTLQQTFTTQLPYYNWTWKQRTVGKHVIKIVAYDFDGNVFSKEIQVRKLL